MKEQIEKFKKEKIVIHCETQEEYDELMKLLVKYYIGWSCGTKATSENHWKMYEHNTCIEYDKTHLMYCDVEYFTRNDYQIIKYKDFIKEGNDKKMMPTSMSLNLGNLFYSPIKKEVKLEKYIINNGATILFWSDKSKTISKRHKEDAFDKELGFLFAYYYKKCGLSNAARKRIIDCIDYNKIKTFLFEFYVKDSGKTYEQARSYLKNLKVEKQRVKEEKKPIENNAKLTIEDIVNPLSDLKLIEEMVEEVKEDSFKIGDKVRIIGDSKLKHFFQIGSIATIKQIELDSLYLVQNEIEQFVDIEDVEKVN